MAQTLQWHNEDPLTIYDVAVADVTNITETPVQTLTADPLKMRTSANLNPTDGQDVAKWYADEFSAYRDARVVFDTNDNMEGLPPQAGDFTYVFTGLNIPTYTSSIDVYLLPMVLLQVLKEYSTFKVIYESTTDQTILYF